jgi:hypothetical protein
VLHVLSTLTGLAVCLACRGRTVFIAGIQKAPDVLRGFLKQKLHFDFDVDAGGEIEIHEGVDGFGSGLGDVDEALVGAHLKLFTRVLVNVRRAQHGHTTFLSRERDGTGDVGAGAGGGVNNLLCALINDLGIVSLEANANALLFLGLSFGGGC